MCLEIKKNKWILMLLAGILLVVIAIPTKKTTGSSLGTDLKTYETEETNLESRLESTLAKMQGVGEVHVMITFQEKDVPEGIVVIAEGGKNAVVVRNITDVVQALFNVDSHKIKVIEKNQNK